MEGVALPELLVGFRFHPTDEELIIHYLQKKVSSSPLPASIIADIDPYDHDPWDLPAKAFSGENEWYFFSRKNPEYPNGAQPNRAAGAGYWKATGADIPIVSASGSTSPEKVGVKKSLVFYKGKLHEGVMTNWVMNEYWLAQTLTDQPLDDWVLCRLFQKVNHFPGMVSCSELEVPSPSATDVQRTREKPATPRQMENLPSHATSDAEFGSFSRLVLNEGPSMENLPSHATSDANNAAVSSAESGSDSSMNWSAHSLQETSGRPMNIFDIFLIKIRREQRESNPGL